MSDPATPRRRRPRPVPSLLAAAVVLILAVVVVNRMDSAGSERDDLAASWAADLDAWAADTLERIGPEAIPPAHGYDLAAMLDADLTQPVRPGSGLAEVAPEDLDLINAACTATTSFIDAVAGSVQPPAAPPGLDPDQREAEEPAERFGDYQEALAGYQQRTGSVQARAQMFCGTYPALVAAHVDSAGHREEILGALQCDESGCELVEEADWAVAGTAVEEGLVAPNERIGASLRTQCYLAELQPVCAADAAEAAELARVWRVWSETPDDDTHLAEVGAVTSEAEEAFTVAAEDVGGDRDGVQEVAHEALAEIGAAFTSGSEEFASAVRSHGS